MRLSWLNLDILRIWSDCPCCHVSNPKRFLVALVHDYQTSWRRLPFVYCALAQGLGKAAGMVVVATVAEVLALCVALAGMASMEMTTAQGRTAPFRALQGLALKQ